LKPDFPDKRSALLLSHEFRLVNDARPPDPV